MSYEPPSDPRGPGRSCRRGALLGLIALVAAILPPSPPLAAQHIPLRPLVMRGHRVLGIDITTAEDGDYDAAMALAIGAGAQAVSLSFGWDDIETAPGRYGNPYLGIADFYYPLWGVSVTLTIAPIDTNRNRMPPDLAGLPFDDPLVIARFEALLDYVFTQIPDLTLECFSIGNEVDAYLGVDPVLWQSWEYFFVAVKSHAAALAGLTPIGVKATYEGLTGAARPFLISLNRHTDEVMATYYPLENDFTVRPPEVVSGDMQRLTSIYPGQTIDLLEAGYPAGGLTGSSQQAQARFVAALFRAWDLNAKQIRAVHFTWLTDISPEDVAFYKDYYGIDDPIFLDYLATLGLRTYPGSGTDKQAFGVLGTEAKKRGW